MCLSVEGRLKKRKNKNVSDIQRHVCFLMKKIKLETISGTLESAQQNKVCWKEFIGRIEHLPSPVSILVPLARLVLDFLVSEYP